VVAAGCGALVAGAAGGCAPHATISASSANNNMNVRKELRLNMVSSSEPKKKDNSIA
jgi:hypothetical protein